MIRIRPLRPDDWAAIEHLFGPRGACGGCWCMAWRRESSAELKKNQGAPNKRAFKRLVEKGSALGCLAFDGERPVGWCSVGPRASFKLLERKRVYRTPWNEKTWSITCFLIAREARGKGVATALARAAAELAFANDAEVVEGYPVLTPKDGKALPPVFAWTGVPGVFRGAGFKPHPDNPRVWAIGVAGLRGCGVAG
ncbi:MAG: GNAT family N-acetyltransferase [Thermoanaerobaculia bacterium]